MTQLIVSLDDATLLNNVKTAIRMLRGVKSVKVYNDNVKPNSKTIKAMQEAESGNTIVCDNIEEYLKLVDYGLQD